MPPDGSGRGVRDRFCRLALQPEDSTRESRGGNPVGRSGAEEPEIDEQGVPIAEGRDRGRRRFAELESGSGIEDRLPAVLPFREIDAVRHGRNL